jgi:predicted metal-dependent peptidase
MTVDDIIKKAIFRMLFSYRLFGNLACNLRRVHREEIKTMATDAKSLFYSEEFVRGHKEEEITFVVAHEVLHAALGHCNPYRMGNRKIMVIDGLGRETYLWGIACDYVVNYILKEVVDEAQRSGKKVFMIMPKSALYDVKYKGMTVEQVYSELAQESKGWPKKPKSSGAGNLPGMPGNQGVCDDHMSAEELKTLIGDAEAKKIEGQWKNRLEKELIAMKQQQGHLPSSMQCLEALIMTEPKVDWRQLLHDHVMNMYKSTYQLNPPNKRFFHLNMIMPSVQGEHLDAGLAVDTSGSFVSFLPIIYGELQHIFNSFDSYNITLIEADAAVDAVYDYGLGEDFTSNTPKGTGGGGTSFVPACDWLTENRPNVKLLIYATDGYGTFPTVPPGYHVIWIVPKGQLAPEKFPFGEVVVFDPEEGTL